LRALYGLRRSPRLWHNELSSFLQSIGLTPVPGVNCIHYNEWLVVFFFVDDIICLYRKVHQAKFDLFEQQLSNQYELHKMGEPEYFLGIRLTRNRANQSITLCQNAHFEKLSKRFKKSLFNRKVYTPLPSEPILPFESTATPSQVKGMQEKVGGMGYAAYITRINIALATSVLAKQQLNPSPAHLHAANHCLTYLRDRKHYSIEYHGLDTS
jgi:hypothetical protein